MKKVTTSDIVKSSIAFLIKYRQQFLSVLGILVISVAFCLYFFFKYRGLRVRTAEQLSHAQALIAAGKASEAMKLLDNIISKSPRSELSYYAWLFKGNLLYDRKEYESAKKAYNSIIKGNKLDKMLPFVYSNLARCEENLKNYENAIKIYNSALEKFPDHFISPELYSSLARNYVKIGTLQKAKDIYHQIIILFPETYWARVAKERLEFLKKK